jgi:C-terminal processing protease CtpA/Prc
VVTTYSQDTSGATTEPGTAGNIGGGLLKRFTVTFAYRRQTLYLQPNANYGKREHYDRSGLVLVQTKSGLRVIDALTNTPAAQAGIKPGDVIVGVNGAPASSVGLLLLRTMLRAAPGTQVKLALSRSGVTQTVTLTLRDYV